MVPEEPQSPCSLERVSPGSPWSSRSGPALVPASRTLRRPVSFPRAREVGRDEGAKARGFLRENGTRAVTHTAREKRGNSTARRYDHDASSLEPRERRVMAKVSLNAHYEARIYVRVSLALEDA